ncbi:hypothetical protein [Paracoccus salsus]|uniref:hypothetical protein n=1 Tax=Paracoccus salsus TaxID=2911061 RepID=UPI001F1DDB71|nr:hypothetical protein [Paracoccus salsus]
MDDGFATGVTMTAVWIAIRRPGSANAVKAFPMAAAEAPAQLEGVADMVVSFRSERRYRRVRSFWDDFHQLIDAETIGILREIWMETANCPPAALATRASDMPLQGFVGDLRVPPDPCATIFFPPSHRRESVQPPQCRRRGGADRQGLRHALA